MSDDEYEDYEDAPPRRAKTAKSSQRKKSKSARTGRVYEHLGCGGATQITEGDFTGLCNPFQPVSRTYCASCGRSVGIDDVAWADTGESISDFRSRMRRKSPSWLSAMDWVIGPVIVMSVASLLCLVFIKDPGTLFGAIAAAVIVGPFGWWHLIMPDLGRLSSGIEYRNQQ